MRFVIDTNIFVSAMMNEDSDVSRAVYVAIKRGHLLFSSITFLELLNVIERVSVKKYIKLELKNIILHLLEHSKKIKKVEVTEVITDCPDPKDNKFLELAVCGKADVIISSDVKHLIPMSPYRGIPILRPKEFLEKYG